jgi:outer membrane biogenesis lipoprotein LolB
MRGFFWCAAALLVLVGCKDRQACERSRLDLAKTWEGIKVQAASLKFPRQEQVATMSDAEREERLKRWSQVEEHAALLESAFISRQVTWTSAEKHLGELMQDFGEKPSPEALGQGFDQALERGKQAFQAFKASCR